MNEPKLRAWFPENLSMTKVLTWKHKEEQEMDETYTLILFSRQYQHLMYKKEANTDALELDQWQWEIYFV